MNTISVTCNIIGLSLRTLVNIYVEKLACLAVHFLVWKFLIASLD